MNEITQALKSEQPLSVAQCDELLAKARQRNGEVEARLAAIKDGGRERIRVLTTGTAEDVRALDDELDTLKVESKQLRAQMAALADAKQTGKAREGAAAMPGHHAELNKRLADLEQAQANVADAWRNLDAVYNQAMQDRIAAVRGGYDPKSASAELVQRIANAKAGGCNTRCRVAGLSAANIQDELGEERQQVAA